MSYWRLTEENCGQASPLEQLAAHVSQDQAYQENIGATCVGYHEEVVAPPQSFKMNELLLEMQSIETHNSRSTSTIPPVQPCSVPVNYFNHDFGSAEYDNEPMQAHANLNLATPLLFNRDPFQIMPHNLLEWKANIFPSHLKSGDSFTLSDEEHLSSSDVQNEDRESGSDLEDDIPTENEMLQIQEALRDPKLDENGVDKEERFGNTNIKDGTARKVSNKLQNYLHYDGLSVKDVYGVTGLGITFTEAEYFYNFVENYVLHKSRYYYKKYQPEPRQKKEEEEIRMCVSGSDKAVRRRGQCFHSRNDQVCFEILHFEIENENIAEHMAMNEQHSDAITAAKYCFNFGNYVFLLTDLYLHEHCFYQACQILFDWLKTHPEYADIVPPYFTMEDKASTSIDKEQLQALQKMFIKAARRNPININIWVQAALGKLCQIDRDYDKSVDCYLSILKSKTDNSSNDFAYVWLSLAESFALMDKPDEAIEALHKIMYDPVQGIKATANIGLIYMYQRNYKKAATYLLDAISTKTEKLGFDDSDVSLKNLWARLRLCCELMSREDLCQAIDKKHDNMKMIFDNLYDLQLFPNTNMTNIVNRMERTSIMAFNNGRPLSLSNNAIYYRYKNCEME